MLNLSDNELDRLSREAASQHDPGDLMGPGAWDRLEVRLDKELGRPGPDVPRGVRGIRRLPFQYAPMILLIVGVSYYFIKQAKGRQAGNSGSPPLTVVKTPQQKPGSMASDSSLKNPDYSDKSTSTPYHQDQSQNTESSGSGSASTTPSSSSVAPAGSSAAPSNASAAPAGSSTPPAGTSPIPAGTPSARDKASTAPGNTPAARSAASGANSNTSAGQTHSGRHGRSPNNKDKSLLSDHKKTSSDNPTGLTDLSGAQTSSGNPSPSGNSPLSGNPASSATQKPSGPADASWSYVQRPRSLRNHPAISDSALRAYTAQTPTNPGKKSGPSLRINRSLTFGLQIAPDFSSVNSLAGDKPGSSIGLTVDYRFLDRWHIGTGLLFSKKNYTARATDYHAPHSYYQTVGLKNVDFIKGTMTMMEIPIDLRYDFSVTGNTVFFASGGVSTYLFGSENCNYYYDFAGREVCREFKYDNKHSLLNSANLSLGVETGISNSFSIMVAPYMRLPLSDLGFGKIRMSSVGINVALRFSPVISRKRQH